jgi:lysyl-tRNA synthetase class 2
MANNDVPMSRRVDRWAGAVPPLIAALAVALGLVDIVSALTPERSRRVHELTRILPLGVTHEATAATAVAGVLLILLGSGLRRRKRRAWRAALYLSLLTAGLHIAKGIDVAEAVLSLVLAVALVATSKRFHAAGDPRTRWRAPAAFVLLAVVSLGLGWLLLTARGGSITGYPSASTRWIEIVDGMVGVTGPLHFRNDGTSDLVYSVLASLGAMTVLVPAYLVFRPPEPPARLDDQAEQRLRELLARHGRRDSLGYFAVRRDKAAIFSPTGKAAVSYRVVSGVMLASGDPIGDPEAWPGAIRAFVEEARRHAWVPAVIGCSELGGEAWVREAGLRALELGDEAIVPVAEFSLDGRAMRNVRQMVARTERAGYCTSVRRVSELSEDDIVALRRQAAEWRDSETERGFSMALGRFGDPADGDCVVVTAQQGDRLSAVLHFVPWGTDGLSLDLMRRDRSSDAGLNEAMIVAAVQKAPEFGVTRLSLNFSVFRSALERGGRLGAGPVLRVWRGLLLWASRWFQIESLYRFNAKFRPEWEPRYICYPAARDVPRIAIAALEAEAFLVMPTLPRLSAVLRKWTRPHRAPSAPARAEG